MLEVSIIVLIVALPRDSSNASFSSGSHLVGRCPSLQRSPPCSCIYYETIYFLWVGLPPRLVIQKQTMGVKYHWSRLLVSESGHSVDMNSARY